MKLDQLLLGQIPEAIYFALFMIFTKQLKEKRIFFTFLMVLEYVLLKLIFPFNIWFHVTYTFTTYITLKLLYREKSQITDIFIFSISGISLLSISALCGALYANGILPYTFCLIINRVCLFTLLLTLRNKLKYIQNLYKTLWNRNDRLKKRKMKSTTFRSINVFAFNLIFYIINIGMLYAIYFNLK